MASRQDLQRINRTLLRRALLLLAAVLVAMLFGGAGYVFLEGSGWGDAIYMAVITMAAVGYEEVVPLSRAGRIFTIGLIFIGIAIIALWVASITSFVVEADLKLVFWRRRMRKRIEALSGHTILCGAGRTGLPIIEQFTREGRPLVVVENHAELALSLPQQFPGLLVLQGDCTQDSTLLEAGIKQATGLVACLSSDTDNLYLVLSARALSHDLTIVARAFEDASRQKMLRAGANDVINPLAIGGYRIAERLLKPDVNNLIRLLIAGGADNVSLNQFRVEEGMACTGRTLKELDLPSRAGLTLVAILRDGGSRYVQPLANERVLPGDSLLFISRSNGQDAERLLSGRLPS